MKMEATSDFDWVGTIHNSITVISLAYQMYFCDFDIWSSKNENFRYKLSYLLSQFQPHVLFKWLLIFNSQHIIIYYLTGNK